MDKPNGPEYDNHHNALVCPYCNPDGKDEMVDAMKGKLARQELEIKRLREVVATAYDLDCWVGEKAGALGVMPELDPERVEALRE